MRVTMAHQLKELASLEKLLESHIPEYKLQAYMHSFRVEFCDTCEVIAALTTDEFQQLGVAIGHRRRIRIAAQSLCSSVTEPQVTVFAPSRTKKEKHHSRFPTGMRNPFATSSSSEENDGNHHTVAPSQLLMSPSAFATDVAFQPHRRKGKAKLQNTDIIEEELALPLLPEMLSIASTERQTARPTGGTKPLQTTSAFTQDALQAAAIGGANNAERSSLLSRRSSDMSIKGRRQRRRNQQYSPERDEHDGDPLTIVGLSDVLLRESPLLYNHPSQQSFSGEVQWIRLSGNRPTLEGFLREMHVLRKQLGFPSAFERLFLNNKPLPFLELGGESAETDQAATMVGLLLRIPDLSDEFGTSITTITNRVCFMIHLPARVIVTYHACEEDLFEDFQREWAAGRFAGADIDKIADMMIRRVLRTYNTGVTKLRDAVDELESREQGAATRKLDDTARVQQFSIIAKKAAVYKRCADASRDTLQELEAVPWLEDVARTLGDGLATVSSMTDELASNALGSMDLTIALSEFKSNSNLKNFTYMSILIQPISLGTGWYGMNWGNMPELEFENGYFIFTGAIILFALLIFTKFVLQDILVERLFTAEGNAGSGSSSTGSDDDNGWRCFWPFNVFSAAVRRRSMHKGDSPSDDEGERPWKRSSILLPVSSESISSPNFGSAKNMFDDVVPLMLEGDDGKGTNSTTVTDF
ncbi:CorA metal ion transporter, putative [Bodo saltans]|uniref:CorA metal ion transporter, putative n=1 Tax=Bodo saltans TaxID=75058 RepID=A0A0S4KN17_BODSA|nr:CorA metal ion transporter, putative [Bodo saltans]|eukprot:CUI14912.1 CorA metal ion transporter, putative [Bodo saltans]